MATWRLNHYRDYQNFSTWALYGRIQLAKTRPMNAQNPELPPVETTPLPDHKDRSTGLLIFGILTILLGCITGMLLLMMLVGQVAVRSAHVTTVPASILLLDVFIYGILAVALIWLGIGSIKARRWARALLLIFSWSWLVVGVYAILGAILILPMVLEGIRAATPPGQPAMPAAAIGVAVVIACLVVGVFSSLCRRFGLFSTKAGM